MINMVREKKNINESELHQLKQNGELYKWKEDYKKTYLTDYFKFSKSGSITKIFDYICKNVNIDIEKNERFVYFIDYVYLLDEVRGYQFGNLTPDYKTFLHNGLERMKISVPNTNFGNDYNNIIDSIETLVKRIIDTLKRTDTIYCEKKIKWFEKMINDKADHFEEAVQRVLFVNQIMWQTDHRLIGIGAMDDYLYYLYERDISVGYLTKSDAKRILSDFILELHNYYWLKSNMLMGDTGQIFVLGKSGNDGEYIYNDLTVMIIEIIEELAIPEPKVLLRVNNNTPIELIKIATKCMASGVGSPLLSNDEVVVPCLKEFGVLKNDALEYTVSACWEPLIGGKSASLNNMTTLNFIRPFENLFKREHVEKIQSFGELIDKYEFYLEKNLRAIKRVLDGAVFQYDPILSVFMKDCKEHEKDVSKGGANYFNAGITSVALGNVVDSLLNIKKYVFDDRCLSLLEVKELILFNFENHEDFLKELKNKKREFGVDKHEAIQLTNFIINMVTKYTKDYRTPYGGRLKFGLSAPTYIDAAINSNASFDGRRAEEPFVVHISNETASSYSEIINFASALDYKENRFNGNVIDFMTNPSFMNDNLEKFSYLIVGAINQGFFQMQVNVVSSDILIRAKECPSESPNLIVRVWGFSAYFKDLPDSYKDLLIERALKNEGKYIV